MRTYLLEIKYEFLSLVRTPRFSVGTILIPLMFYVFFGILMNRGPVKAGTIATYTLATMSTFGIMVAALFSLGAGIASDRGLGWLEVKRASPMPPLSYFLAKVAGAALMALAVTVLLAITGILFGGIHLGALALFRLIAGLTLCSIPFCALGFFLGTLATPSSAPAFVNLVALPMAFCSGLWVPLQYLPHAIQRIAPLMPAYHAARLGFFWAGLDPKVNPWASIQALASLTLVFAGLAWFAWRRQESQANA